MALEIKKTKIPQGYEKEAEKILSNLPSLNKALKSATYDEVRMLIKVEADSKCRLTTLQRLVARFNVLESKVNEQELMEYVAQKNRQ